MEASVKMKRFHWDLSENQGFRAERRKFPKLTELGSDSFYYSQDEIRELIGVRAGIVESRVCCRNLIWPGHSTAVRGNLPQLASGNKRDPYESERKWGHLRSAMDPTEREFYKVLEDLLGEDGPGFFQTTIFTSSGDRVNGKEWDANPKIQNSIEGATEKNQ